MLPLEIRLHLREVRKSRGLTLQAVEAAAMRVQSARILLAGTSSMAAPDQDRPALGHYSKSYLQRVEVGEAAMDVVTLWGLATLYNTAPHVLVEYVDWPVPTPCTCPCHNAREELR